MVKKKPGSMLRRNLDGKNKPQRRRRAGKKEVNIIFGDILGVNGSTNLEEERQETHQRQTKLKDRLSKLPAGDSEDEVGGRPVARARKLPALVDIDEEKENEDGDVAKASDSPREEKPKKAPKGRRVTETPPVKDHSEENSELRRINKELEALNDYDLYISAGPGNQRWLPMEKHDSASVSKSAVLADKTNENGTGVITVLCICD